MKLPKQQDAQIEDSIDTICGYAYQSGLSTLTLTTTLEIVLRSTSLSQANRAVLVKSLYPASRVPSQLICTAVASLGQGKQKLPVSLQQSLLKWIIQVYDVLEDPSILSKLYTVLFNMLDFISLRYDCTLCLNLLANLTQSNAVPSTRNDNPEKAYQTIPNPDAVSSDSRFPSHHILRKLGRLDLSKRVAREPALIGLIRVYEEHYPEAFSGEKLTGRAFGFSVSSVGCLKME